MILRNNATEKSLHKEIFHPYGSSKGRLKAPYWPVALAADAMGKRYLSDEVLESAIGNWQTLYDAVILGRRISNWKQGKT